MNTFYVKAWEPNQDPATERPRITTWYGDAHRAREDYDWRKDIPAEPTEFGTPQVPLYSCLELGSNDGGPLLVWYRG